MLLITVISVLCHNIPFASRKIRFSYSVLTAAKVTLTIAVILAVLFCEIVNSVSGIRELGRKVIAVFTQVVITVSRELHQGIILLMINHAIEPQRPYPGLHNH